MRNRREKKNGDKPKFVVCCVCEQRPASGKRPDGTTWKQCGCDPYPTDPAGERLEVLKAEARRLSRMGLLRNQVRKKDGKGRTGEPPVNDHELSLSFAVATLH